MGRGVPQVSGRESRRLRHILQPASRASSAPLGNSSRSRRIASLDYEPFFSDNADFEFESDLATSGVASTVTYDPLGRAIQVDLPNGTRRRVSFTPWESTTFDENDCSTDADLIADPALLGRASAHADTPATVRLDAQGRVYATDELLTTSTTFTTNLTLDVVGNPT